MFTQDYFEKHFKLHNKIVLYTPDDIKLEFTKEPHFHMSGGHTSLDLMDMLISLGNEKSVPFNVLLDYWDVEKRAHYNQSEEFEIIIDGTHQKIQDKERKPQIEIKNP